MTNAELQHRLGQDSIFFNQLILPEWFSLSTPDFHSLIYKPLMNPKVSLLVVQMPRGFGKTTILQGYLTQQVAHLGHPVIVYIGDTYTQAEMHTESVRLELEDSERIQELYGTQQGRKWTSSIWTTKAGVTVVPKGSGQSIRGLKVGKSRPSLVIIDDPENDENTETPEQRDKLWRHLYAVVKPMLQAGRKNVKIVYLGTPIHEDCVLIRFLDMLSKPPFSDDPTIQVVRLGARDRFGESIWPALWPTDRLQAEEELYAAAGQLDVFYREYLGEVIASSDASFPLDKVTYYTEGELPNDLRTYAAIDIAFSSVRGRDFSSIVIVSVSAKTGNLYVRVAERSRARPNEFLQRMIRYHERFRPSRWFVQNVVLDEFFKFYATEQNCRLPFEKIKISRRKDAKFRRISSLEPLYITRRLQMLRRHTDLLRELVMFPRSKHDDLCDPLASMLQQIRIPLFAPRIVRTAEQGSLESIENTLRRRRLASRFGLTYVPPSMRGQRHAA